MSQLHFYISAKIKLENAVLKISFTIATKNKVLRKSPAKDVQDLLEKV